MSVSLAIIAMFLVMFEEAVADRFLTAVENRPILSDVAAEPTGLEDELRHAHERLQATTEEM